MWTQFFKTLYRYRNLLTVIITFTCAAIFGLFQFTDPFNIYGKQEGPLKEISFSFAKTTLPFPEIPKSAPRRSKASQNLSGARAGVAVGDFNNDGWDDILVISDDFLLLKNNEGKEFTVANEESGLSEFSWIGSSGSGVVSGAVFLDFDNDGWEDIYITRRGRSHFLLKNVREKFVIWQELKFNEDSKMPALADINRDGFVDIYIPNRRNKQTMKYLLKNPEKIFSETLIRNESGGRDRILLNQAGKKFVDKSDDLNFFSTRYTWAVGFSDFNNDNYPDFIIANDFGVDQIFLNEKGTKVRDVTEESLGALRSRFSMSAEIADINGDGLPDIYVSNTNSAVLRRGFNSLWVNQGGNTPQFKDKARELGVDGCGWSWGAKFIDLDLDGDLDLVVVNGFSQVVTEKFPLWYYTIHNRGIPQPLKVLNEVGINAAAGVGMAPGQQSCVFFNENGHYTDVSREAGFTDTVSSRGLAIFDFDNNGTTDLLVGNSGVSPSLYKTVTKGNQQNWFGIKLVGQASNRDAIGAKVTYLFNNKKTVKEIFPTNGYYAQSSKKIVFPAFDDRNPAIEILWPSGHMQVVKSIELNKYQIINEEK